MSNKERVSKFYYQRKAEVITYLGGQCRMCGATELLEFNHINPGDKSFGIGERMCCESVWDEADKCELLCKSCHIKWTTAQSAAARDLFNSLPVEEQIRLTEHALVHYKAKRPRARRSG